MDGTVSGVSLLHYSKCLLVTPTPQRSSGFTPASLQIASVSSPVGRIGKGQAPSYLYCAEDPGPVVGAVKTVVLKPLQTWRCPVKAYQV